MTIPENPRILIMVLSCITPPFDRLMKAQQDTWDSVYHPQIDTIFYLGNSPAIRLDGNVLHLPCKDDYDGMLWKFKLALDFVMPMNWTFIFRTNASSYVHKRALARFARTLPTTHCYAGISGLVSQNDFHHVNGGGIWLSRDCAKLLQDTISREFTPLVEDGEIGKIMNLHKIPIGYGERIDGSPDMQFVPLCHHYRCTSKSRNRQNEVDTFNQLKKRLNQNYERTTWTDHAR